MSQEQFSTGVSDDDKLWAMLCYLLPLLAIVALFMEDKKNRPYIKFNAVQSIVAAVAVSIITSVTFGCGGVLGFAFFYWAYLAYQGQNVNIPFISDFIKNQGWA